MRLVDDTARGLQSVDGNRFVGYDIPKTFYYRTVFRVSYVAIPVFVTNRQ